MKCDWLLCSPGCNLQFGKQNDGANLAVTSPLQRLGEWSRGPGRRLPPTEFFIWNTFHNGCEGGSIRRWTVNVSRLPRNCNN